MEEEQGFTNDLVDISFALEESPEAEYNIQRRIYEQPVAATIEFPQYKVHVYEGASSDVLKNIYRVRPAQPAHDSFPNGGGCRNPCHYLCLLVNCFAISRQSKYSIRLP